MRRSQWRVVEIQKDIVFIEDLNGSVSVTNDAENVFATVTSQKFSDDPITRVVYKDSDGEWWEIINNHTTWMGTGIGFERWDGLAWDLLKQTATNA